MARGPISYVASSWGLQHGGPQLGAARPRVAVNLFLACLDRLARQFLPALPVAECLLDSTVLQRMKTDEDRPPARLQADRQGRQQSLQGRQLVVDGDAQGLEHARRRVDRLAAAAARHT